MCLYEIEDQPLGEKSRGIFHTLNAYIYRNSVKFDISSRLA